MDKKISVNYENDKIVSIEVDGVTYTHPEDIPDPEDRARAEMLLNTESEDEFDEPFDSAAFEKEFKEIQRQNARFPTVLFAVFLSVAVILLGVAAFSAFVSYRTVTHEQSAPGKVVNLIQSRSYDSQSGQTTTYFHPVVEFSLPGGSPQRVEMSEGSSPPEFQPGDQVTVLFNPDRPQDARIKSFSSTLLMWLLPLLTGFLGTVFLIVTFIVLRVHRSQQAELARQDQHGNLEPV